MSDTRTFDQRRSDTIARFEIQGSGWLATAGATPGARVIAVAALWLHETFVVTTRDGTPTARNLDASGLGRLVLGTPEDVVMVETVLVASWRATGPTDARATAFVAAMGWNPADEGPDWRYFELRPTHVAAYRGYFELGGHMLMRDGVWRP